LRRVQYVDFRNDYDAPLEALIKGLRRGEHSAGAAARDILAGVAATENPSRDRQTRTVDTAPIETATGSDTVRVAGVPELPQSASSPTSKTAIATIAALALMLSAGLGLKGFAAGANRIESGHLRRARGRSDGGCGYLRRT